MTKQQQKTTGLVIIPSSVLTAMGGASVMRTKTVFVIHLSFQDAPIQRPAIGLRCIPKRMAAAFMRSPVSIVQGSVFP